ncbi:PREDICTED: uncharacterized protein LOC102847911 [Elephantulus edwardii]|uniref:uncharacterized protein LOC102847911 n=1 Tax=Elephantulus edwardii TaxID=28737 RepID=UPI0003F0994E|nr:PREDICTED: uncharacterized protein LOC102847911 [Elephantulus edwardii]
METSAQDPPSSTGLLTQPATDKSTGEPPLPSLPLPSPTVPPQGGPHSKGWAGPQATASRALRPPARGTLSCNPSLDHPGIPSSFMQTTLHEAEGTHFLRPTLVDRNSWAPTSRGSINDNDKKRACSDVIQTFTSGRRGQGSPPGAPGSHGHYVQPGPQELSMFLRPNDKAVSKGTFWKVLCWHYQQKEHTSTQFQGHPDRTGTIRGNVFEISGTRLLQVTAQAQVTVPDGAYVCVSNSENAYLGLVDSGPATATTQPSREATAQTRMKGGFLGSPLNTSSKSKAAEPGQELEFATSSDASRALPLQGGSGPAEDRPAMPGLVLTRVAAKTMTTHTAQVAENERDGEEYFPAMKLDHLENSAPRRLHSASGTPLKAKQGLCPTYFQKVIARPFLLVSLGMEALLIQVQQHRHSPASTDLQEVAVHEATTGQADQEQESLELGTHLSSAILDRTSCPTTMTPRQWEEGLPAATLGSSEPAEDGQSHAELSRTVLKISLK